MSEKDISEFKEQFKAIGYSLARKAKVKVKRMRNQTDEQIDEINVDFVRALREELGVKINKFIHDYETSLNKQIAENVKDISKRILAVKKELFADLKNHVMDKIVEFKKSNPDKYARSIRNRLSEYIEYFNDEIILHLAEDDKGMFEKIRENWPDKEIILADESLESIGGFIASNKDSTVYINQTFEKIFEKKELGIKSIFSQVFPIYVDSRRSATELMKERNVYTLTDFPQKLKTFMEDHHIPEDKL